MSQATPRWSHETGLPSRQSEEDRGNLLQRRANIRSSLASSASQMTRTCETPRDKRSSQDESSTPKMTNSSSTCKLPSLATRTDLDLIPDVSSDSSKLHDPFAENFGVKNEAGEIVLHEATAEIVRIAIFAYANYDESCELIGPGRVSIMFYPNIGEIRVILQATEHLWPVRNERIEENQTFDYDCWFWRNDGRSRMCRRREDLAPCEIERGFVFGDWNYYGVAFHLEDEIVDLKNAIRSIQARMSNNRIPRGDDLQDNSSLRVARFWCGTGLRASNFKLFCVHLGSVWRINVSYSVEHDKNGMVALASRNETPSVLEMLVIFRNRNGDEIEDVRKCYRITSTLGLVVSHITPENKKDSVWEWTIAGDVWACAFRSNEETESFRKIVDTYVSDLKKSSKKFFGRK